MASTRLAPHKSTLDSLPPELISTILGHLDLKSILKCTQVCHLLHDIVNTPTLDYHIMLAVQGKEEGSMTTFDTEEKIATLSLHSSRWDTLDFTTKQTIPVHHGRWWEFYGNVLGQTTPDSTRIDFMQLGSPTRGVPQEQWFVESADVNVNLRYCDVRIDPAQDLLILAENNIWRDNLPVAEAGYIFHIRHAKTGERHPQSSIEQMCIIRGQPSHIAGFIMKICGDFFGVLVQDQLDSYDLRIWNWKTGTLHLHLTGLEIHSFAFLSEKDIIVAVGPGDWQWNASFQVPHLKIIGFIEPGAEPVSITDSQFKSLFELPPLRHGTTLDSLYLECEPSASWRPKIATPFFNDPQNRVCIIKLGAVGKTFHLAVPLDTFQTHLKVHVSGTRLVWDAWGPQGSRLIQPDRRLDDLLLFNLCVYGTRYVTPIAMDGSEGRQIMLEVYDFNQLAARKAALEESSLPEGVDVCTEPVTTSSEIFNYPVTTRLPYRRTRFSLDKRPQGVLLGEDSLIVVRDDKFLIKTI